ncbi:cell division protein FtsQ/DivIB [Desmospora profundinema]|uniref:Cell division protein FtsQ n=1 Tax=Desmospora profundinema TaxID=1571184 RepID=A0ABU1IJ45_9BACL|nr:FtsQ-type POTRA domain-containing protein [Desmospora profundinema]MDR6224795.1 cell division protein FtsQ [Desmospora profundinema]
MEERVRPLRSPTRSRKPPSFVAILFILLFFLGTLIILFLESPLGEIRDVRIKGNHMVTEEELLQLARLEKGSSYFHWDGGEAERRIAALPEVREAVVTKTFPGTVDIEVKESHRVAFWVEGSLAYPVLGNGEILKDRPWSGNLDKPLLRGWEKRGEWDPALARGLADLPKRIQADLSEIRPGEDSTYPDLVRVYTRNHHVVRVRIRDFGEKIPYYSMFRNRPPGTLNLLESTWFEPEKE